MSSPKGRIPIPGSERTALPGARAVGAPDPNERIEVTVVIRPRPSSRSLPSVKEIGTRMPHERQYLSRKELEDTRGAATDDLAKVEQFADEHGLSVVEASPARRTIVLSGTVASLSEAFGVYLANYEYSGGSYRGRTGPVHVPAELADIVQGVFGLDNRPQAQPHFRRREDMKGTRPHAGPTGFTPVQLAQLYNFPAGLNGQGQCIAIIELGGGYRTADLNSYFAQLGIPKPSISSVSVDGGHNHPTGSPGGPDGEVMLDIEVAGAVAPGARIAVYFAPNTTRGFLDAITTAVHDTQRKPSVISISWGSAEKNWSRNALQAFDQAFQEAALLGVTVCCASGDNGSSDGENDSLAHVDFPASSPSALGCGGTRLDVSNGAISREVVWNEGANGGATGGGVSDFFPLPSYQDGANIPASLNPGGIVGRGVPDVAGDADPNTGYQILVDGQRAVFGGTSAVAPLWAGLIALINQKLAKPVGFLNPLLYGQLATAGVVRDITTGSNDISQLGGYKSGQGWDACSGLGTPDGAKLLSALDGGADVSSVAATAKPTK